MMKKNLEKEIKRLDKDLNCGLSSEEVKERLELGYQNKSKKKVGKSYFEIIRDNVFTLFNIVYLCIAIVFIVFIILLNKTGHAEEANRYFGFSKFIFLVPVLLNLIIGTTQEIRSKIILNKMKLVNEANSYVIRDSKITKIKSSNIVLDDILKIQAGEQAQVDMILKSGVVSVDESFLTGEADLVEKKPGDKIYQGSMIIIGGGIARCENVGDDTYTSKLQASVKSIGQHKSELMTDIKKIINWLSILLLIVIIIVVTTLCYKVIRWGDDSALWASAGVEATMSLTDPVSWARIFICASAFAIGLIPSGLVLMTSITLAVSIVNLSKNKTMVQELYSLENLSRVDTICLDKTGTLTDGTMSVVDAKSFVDEAKAINILKDILATQSSTNQTSVALINKYGVSADVSYEKVIPFSSSIKASGIIYKDGKRALLGAPEYLLGGINDSYIDERTKLGNRVLALIEDDTLLMLISLEDTIRKSAINTIKYFYDNKVDVIIISGDNIKTVSKISELCGVRNTHKQISLEGVSLEELETIVPNYKIFGRVSPEQKQKIIEVLQQNGRKVAMTGDGVNDILALRKANASITFEKATDAAKSCSDVILLDNDFSHLEQVISQGRKVVNNVTRSSVLFLMKTIAIALLAVCLIVTKKGQMWYSLENIYLLETAVIALGGFLLSLENKSEPIKGKFRINVLSKAIPSGLLILIGAIIPVCLNAIPKWFGIDPIIKNENVGSLISILTVLAGVTVTYSLCKPFNKYRIITLLFVISLALLFSFAFPNTFIGGRPTNLKMIFDNTIFNEIFQPWHSSVFINLIHNYWCLIIIGMFVFGAIPLYLLLIRFVNKTLLKYAIKLDKKLEEKEEKL